MMFSQMLVAMKREMPEPRPYPFWSISSRQITMMPAMNSCTAHGFPIRPGQDHVTEMMAVW